MNIAAGHVSPEEMMALIDGELSLTEAKAVESHVEYCSECAQIAEQLRRTSDSFSAWEVPIVPSKVEHSIAEFVSKAKSGIDVPKPNLFLRASSWSWKQYAVFGMGAIASLVIIAGIGTPMLRQRPGAAVEMMSGPAPYLPTRRDAGSIEGRLEGIPQGSMGKLQKDVGLGAQIGGGSTALEDVLPQSAEPMIARTVGLTIVVNDFATARPSLDAILSRYRGYAAQLNVSTAQNAPRSLRASLRIPAPALPSAMTDLRRLGRVEIESQSGEEVTRQHADLVARLKNARDTEQRLREILAQRTGKITDVLKVEEEIARVRGEIESMEAEQKALEHRVEFANVELQLAEEYKAQLNPPAPSVSTRIHNAFVAGYQNASDTILGIALFFIENGPVLLIWLSILAVPMLLLWRRYRRMSTTL